MTTKTVSIRELLRDSKVLEGYDFVEVENKKTREYKGIFISPKYAAEFKQFLEARKKQEIDEKLRRIRKYAGKGKIEEGFNRLSSNQIREKVAKDKYGN